MLAILEYGGVVMALILLLSLVATVIIVERLLYFRKIKVDEEQILNRLKNALEKEHYDEALSICESNPCPVSNLMKVGIEYRNYSPQVIKDTVLDAANLEIPSMERFLSSLGTIANISPLLGLLGTVVGNIQAFDVLNGLGGAGDPSALAGGISKALITTAAGIIVSIPSTIFYNYLVTKVNHTIIRLENRVSELVALLKKEKV
ncbi:MotA/TolQ/ExbB proton channel family protein [Spirochaeta cellobiosiphila]|uniref:MotA/TolQ/ExbB proton channel family protein n=1 Tax=Spirochaeta cellobiosiphila TaxID=504483 RepID=UPI00041BAFD0|nr:MotA/TolQ/ExbB proton channel family protein [Spirochaeta cellobiosiphila]